jgi:hypothetical protein
VWCGVVWWTPSHWPLATITRCYNYYLAPPIITAVRANN